MLSVLFLMRDVWKIPVTVQFWFIQNQLWHPEWYKQNLYSLSGEATDRTHDTCFPFYTLNLLVNMREETFVFYILSSLRTSCMASPPDPSSLTWHVINISLCFLHYFYNNTTPACMFILSAECSTGGHSSPPREINKPLVQVMLNWCLWI